MNRLYILLSVAALCLSPVLADTGRATLSVGFSPHLFSDVNEADAVASIKVWGDTILVRRGIDLTSVPVIYSSSATMREALEEGSVDLVGMIPQELFGMEDDIGLDHFHFTSLNGRTTEEYILLVHTDSGIKDLAGLQGKRLGYVDNARMGVSRVWLETLLLEQGFSDFQEHFREVEGHAKSSKAVLGLFFGKTDACLVMRTGFETMVELNPQIGRSLHVLQTSPGFIPGLVCFRADCDPDLKREVVAGLKGLDQDVRGQQLLMVFQSDKLTEGPIEKLDTTREWFDRHALLKQNSAGRKAETAEGGK
ncbi:MAG: PhnD/SsuA/transferrin family substrate-binding protein [Verrucomicrobiota bacterium]